MTRIDAPMNCEIEIAVTNLRRGNFKSVLFDFDGTLSLIREGWPEVMIPMMVEVLQETGTRETREELFQKVEEFVMRLNGKQTIFQMIQLAEEVEKRGGKAKEPLEYKHEYHRRLMERIQYRLQDLEEKKIAPHHWTVPASHELLQSLKDRGLKLYLASGTDLKYVLKEAELLGIAHFFGEHIYGALDQHENFSKKMIVEKIIRDHQIRGEELLGFGDGYVEIEEIKRVGGVAVAVASDEVKRQGINTWKRNRLIQAGADLVIPEYRQQAEWLPWLLGDQ